MKKIKILAISVFGLFSLCFAAEESITITTYYPSPHGSYSSLQTDKFGVGDNNSDGNFTAVDVPTTSGDVWIKGRVGIGTGTAGPSNKLHIVGNLRMVDGNQAAGRVMTSDANGVGSWGSIGGGNCTWRPSGVAEASIWSYNPASQYTDLPHVDNSAWYTAKCMTGEMMVGFASSENGSQHEHHQILCCR